MLLGFYLGYKGIQGYMHSAIDSLIEGCQRTIYLFSLMIGFNSYNIYVLLCGALPYDNISICPNLGN